jgi:hypothetical protein
MLKQTPKANAKPRFTEKKQHERIMRVALKPRAEKTGGALESAFKTVGAASGTATPRRRDNAVPTDRIVEVSAEDAGPLRGAPGWMEVKGQMEAVC